LSLNCSQITPRTVASRKARWQVNSLLKLVAFAQAHTVAAPELQECEEGQTMAEYGVALTVITITVIGAITLLSDGFRNVISSVADILPHS
jgi:Flp pilus assembly pilin Flp